MCIRDSACTHAPARAHTHTHTHTHTLHTMHTFTHTHTHTHARTHARTHACTPAHARTHTHTHTHTHAAGECRFALAAQWATLMVDRAVMITSLTPVLRLLSSELEQRAALHTRLAKPSLRYEKCIYLIDLGCRWCKVYWRFEDIYLLNGSF